MSVFLIMKVRADNIINLLKEKNAISEDKGRTCLNLDNIDDEAFIRYTKQMIDMGKQSLNIEDNKWSKIDLTKDEIKELKHWPIKITSDNSFEYYGNYTINDWVVEIVSLGLKDVAINFVIVAEDEVVDKGKIINGIRK